MSRFLVNFFNFDFISLKVAAHVIGNILGAHEDGTGTATACSASNNNLMAPNLIYTTLSNVLNQYILSSCSINSIKQFLLTTGYG